MAIEIKYVELKTGYHDDGPAWIGKVKVNRNQTTIYFMDKAFRRGQGSSANFYDVETGDEYWLSGIKKRGTNRHWAGHGKIMIDSKVVSEYLHLTNQQELDLNQFAIVDIEDTFPVERILQFENEKKGV